MEEECDGCFMKLNTGTFDILKWFPGVKVAKSKRRVIVARTNMPLVPNFQIHSLTSLSDASKDIGIVTIAYLLYQ